MIFIEAHKAILASWFYFLRTRCMTSCFSFSAISAFRIIIQLLFFLILIPPHHSRHFLLFCSFSVYNLYLLPPLHASRLQPFQKCSNKSITDKHHRIHFVQHWAFMKWENLKNFLSLQLFSFCNTQSYCEMILNREMLLLWGQLLRSEKREEKNRQDTLTHTTPTKNDEELKILQFDVSLSFSMARVSVKCEHSWGIEANLWH